MEINQNEVRVEQALGQNNQGPIEQPKSRKPIWIVVGVLVILMLLSGGYYYYKSKSNPMNTLSQTDLVKYYENLNETVDGGKKEKYLVKFNGDGVAGKIFVNGIPVRSGSLTNGNNPITNYMTNGDNIIEIEATLVPNDGNNYCSFEFGHVLDQGISDEPVFDGGKIECGESFKKNGFENLSHNIKTNLPFNLPWLKGKKFENEEATKEKLFAKYQEVHGALSSFDEEKIKTLFKYQLERKAQYMYTTKEDIDKKYIEMIKQHQGDLIKMLDISSIDKLSLEVSKDGFVARLVEIDLKTNRVTEPLGWYDGDLEVNIYLPVWFMLTQDDKIIPIL